MSANAGAMEEFDLDRYLRASKRVDLSDVSWERIRDHPLSEAEARCLAYMMDIETHTVIFLRDLLAMNRSSISRSRRLRLRSSVPTT